MSQRITRATLDVRAENVNRRIAHTGRIVRVQGRSGYFGLDLYADNLREENPNLAMVRTLTCGTKREVGEYLTALMVGMDLVRP